MEYVFSVIVTWKRRRQRPRSACLQTPSWSTCWVWVCWPRNPSFFTCFLHLCSGMLVGASLDFLGSKLLKQLYFLPSGFATHMHCPHTETWIHTGTHRHMHRHTHTSATCSWFQINILFQNTSQDTRAGLPAASPLMWRLIYNAGYLSSFTEGVLDF